MIRALLSKCLPIRLILPAIMSCLAVSPAPAATTAVIKPLAGHPKIEVHVAGRGFGAGEAVDIYFDTTDMLLAVANKKGRVVDHVLSVPSDAVPGKHWISLIGRRDGDAAQKAFTVRTDWTQRGFAPNGKRSNPYENVLDAGNVARLDVAWRVDIDALESSSPVVAGGVVYVGAQDGLHALDAATGHSKWVGDTHGYVGGTPAVDAVNGLVYAGSSDNNLYAFDIAGHGEWSALTHGRILSSPAVAGGIVYVGSDDKELHAFNAADGNEAWPGFPTGDILRSSPTVADGVVYIGSEDKKIYALNANTGDRVWTQTLGSLIGGSAPTVADGVVYVGSSDGTLYALNAASGAPIWAVQTGNFIWSSPAVVGDVVYVGSEDKSVYAFDAGTGLQLWQAPTDDIVASSPAVANGVVYVESEDGKIYAFDAASGAKLWSAAVAPKGYSSPAVSDGAVYVASKDGAVTAYVLDGGRGRADGRDRAPPLFAALRPDRRLKPS